MSSFSSGDVRVYIWVQVAGCGGTTRAYAWMRGAGAGKACSQPLQLCLEARACTSKVQGCTGKGMLAATPAALEARVCVQPRPEIGCKTCWQLPPISLSRSSISSTCQPLSIAIATANRVTCRHAYSKAVMRTQKGCDQQASFNACTGTEGAGACVLA